MYFHKSLISSMTFLFLLWGANKKQYWDKIAQNVWKKKKKKKHVKIGTSHFKTCLWKIKTDASKQGLMFGKFVCNKTDIVSSHL